MVPFMFSMMLVHAERPAQFDRQAEAGDGEDFVDAFQDAAGDAGGLVLQAAGEVADQLFRFSARRAVPRLTQHLATPACKGLASRSVMLRAL